MFIVSFFKKSQPRILVVKGKAGMGNRLRFLAHAFVYAIASKRDLVIDWSDQTYSSDGQNSFQEYFKSDNLNLFDIELDTLNEFAVFPEIWKGNLSFSISEMTRAIDLSHNWKEREKLLVAPLSRGFDNLAPILVIFSYDQYLASIPPTVLNQVAPEKSPREILVWFFQEILTLDEGLQKRIKSFEAEYPSMIGVHVRQSDKSTEHPLSKCFDKIDRLDDTHSIFLATDNLNVLEQFEERYGTRLVSTPKWYPSAGTKAHQNKQCPDYLENGRRALVDIYLLSQCEILLRQAGSSFTEISDYIAGRQSEAWNE